MVSQKVLKNFRDSAGSLKKVYLLGVPSFNTLLPCSITQLRLKTQLDGAAFIYSGQVSGRYIET